MTPPRPLPESGPLKRIIRWMNQVLDYVISIAPKKGRNIHLRNTSSGCIINAVVPEREGAAAPGGSIRRLQIAAYEGDAYSTQDEDGNNGPTFAIPYYHRTSTYNLGGAQANWTGGSGFSVVGSEIRKHGAGADDYIVVALVPAYFIGQWVYAGEVSPGTDVTINGERVTWIDLTSRALVTVPRDYSICRLENGQPTPRTALIDGGPVH